MTKDLTTKLKRHNGDLKKMIENYASGKDGNDVKKYLQVVQKTAGKKYRYTMDDIDNIVKGFIRMENKKELADYFARKQDQDAVIAPLKATNTEKSLDIFVNVNGGGISGQSGATMLGVARALKNYDPTLLQALRDGGYLTRDGRMVERKKPGQKGARKRFQFSKR